MLIRLLPGYYLWQINPKPDNPTVRCIKIRYIPAEQTSVTQDDIISLTVQTIPLYPSGITRGPSRALQSICVYK